MKYYLAHEDMFFDMKNFIRKILQRFGYDIIKLNQSSLTALPDFEELHKAVFEK